MSELTAQQRYSKRWRYQRAHGIKQIVDAAPARRHVSTLIGAGWSRRAIAGEAQTGPSVISGLANGQSRTITRKTAVRILAIDPSKVPQRPSKQVTEPFVPRIGTVRRLQALLYMGWGYKQISEATGIPTPANLLHQKGRWVTRSTHDKVAAAYRELAMREGPSSRAKAWARKRGYRSPLAWDDIDNDPELGTLPLESDEAELHPPREEYDEAVVLRVLEEHSRPRRLTAAEATEVVRRLLARGHSGNEIAAVWGLKPERYPAAS